MFSLRISNLLLVFLCLSAMALAQDLQAPLTNKADLKVRTVQTFKSTGPDFEETPTLVSFYNSAGQLSSYLENPQMARDSGDYGVTLDYTQQGDLRIEDFGGSGYQYIYAYDDPTSVPIRPNFTRIYHDDKGSVITETSIDGEGRLSVLAEYEIEYDEQGRLIQQKIFKAKDNPMPQADSLPTAVWEATHYYVYNDQGQVYAETIENASYRKEIRTRYNEADLPVGTVESVLSGGWMTRYSYNNLKELILEEHFRLDHKGENSFLEYYMHYTYYSNYLLQSVRKVGPDGKETLFRYEYDFHPTKADNTSSGGAG
ncbi:MAG: hypothetical protein AAF598_14055 [Bacteroidota bacterium]